MTGSHYRQRMTVFLQLRKIVATIGIAAMLGMEGSAWAQSTSIVISEFRFRGPAGASDEFVELMNISATNVNLFGWKLQKSGSNGVKSPLATNISVVLAPGEHFLAAGSTYSGTVPPNRVYPVGIIDEGGVAILTGDDVIVDSVGVVGTGGLQMGYHEGTALFWLGASNLDRSYTRKNGGRQDTDDNNSDFELISPSDPQNHPITIQFDSISKSTNGHVLLQGSGYPVKPHQLLVTTNLANAFIAIATNTADGNGVVQFDVDATGSPARFYRLSYP
jgi:hypothetical protein